MCVCVVDLYIKSFTFSNSNSDKEKKRNMSDDAEASRNILEGALTLHKRLLKEEVQRNEALEEELDDLRARPVVASAEHQELTKKHATISEQCSLLAAELRAIKEDYDAPGLVSSQAW